MTLLIHSVTAADTDPPTDAHRVMLAALRQIATGMPDVTAGLRILRMRDIARAALAEIGDTQCPTTNASNTAALIRTE